MWKVERLPKPILLAACCLLMLLVGVLDHVTGTQVSVTVVYFLPIAMGTWLVSRRTGLFLAIGGALMWLVVERIAGVPYAHPLIQCWNALGLTISFGVVVLLLSALRESHARLEERVRRRTAELQESRESLAHTLANLQKSHAELKATQLQLIQAAKMESVGRLAAGVAHEVKNPLTTILLGIDYLEGLPWSREDKIRGVLQDQRGAVERATAVIGELLDFAAPAGLRRQPEDLNAIIERALDLVKHELTRGRVVVSRQLEAHLPVLALDRKKMEQVFVNAFINAIHAMPEGGMLSLRTYSTPKTAPASSEAARAPITSSDGVDVTAEIDDTGTGIPGEHLTKLFDPFFTTKEPGKGSGLGLSVVRQIIQMHGGTVGLANGPEGGARFTIQFHKKGLGTSC